MYKLLSFFVFLGCQVLDHSFACSSFLFCDMLRVSKFHISSNFAVNFLIFTVSYATY